MSNQEQPAGKMWSGRFREPLDKDFEQWQRSFPFDWRLFQAEISASIAHARAIEAAGILTAEEAEKMCAGLRALGKLDVNARSIYDSAAPFAKSAETAEDVHHFVELELTREVGDLALKLHTGRSRNEQIATDMRLFVRGVIDAAITSLRTWATALTGVAEAAGENVMPSYTHLQRAEPVLVAHWLLAYVAMIERDITRLADARKRMNLCPLGSGAIAGATLKLDRTIAARELGFDGPTPNSMDATSDRDFLLEFTQAAATIGIHASRFAEEITLFSTAEYGFVELPEAFSTGSSAMPQKKNPDLTELVRGKSARLIGAQTALSTLIKGLPLAYNKDLQEAQEQVFDAADTLTGMLALLPKFTAALKFNYARMKTAATTGYLNAMAAATYLSNKGVPFRKAHEIVGHAVRLGLESGRELNDLKIEELRKLSDAFAEDFYSAISLEATLDCHDVAGGTARTRVAEALAAARQRLEDNKASRPANK
ncbi:MAG TPA: argininosuccinate lyase [Acidobacteriaceae bacterium]|nr:argininosuccinate lyase [Acidobacteriaceae bacterium]